MPDIDTLHVVHYGHWQVCDEPHNTEDIPLYHIATANEGSWMDVYFGSDGHLYRCITNLNPPQWMQFSKPELGS